MNPNNYSTLEASRRLHEAGIVLKTDCYWHVPHTGEPELLYDAFVAHLVCGERCKIYPAAQFAEVWRELPETVQHARKKMQLHFEKWRGESYASYENFGLSKSINPTDALIDLLIWLRGRKEAV